MKNKADAEQRKVAKFNAIVMRLLKSFGKHRHFLRECGMKKLELRTSQKCQVYFLKGSKL